MMFKPQSPAEFTGDSNDTNPRMSGESTNIRIFRIFADSHKIRRFVSHSARGYALLLAVLITSATLSAATALASIVIAEIRQTREVAAAIVAYAQAEEQVDKAIFMLRHTDLTLSDISNQLTDASVKPETRLQYFQISENDFVSLAIPQEGVSFAAIEPQITGWTTADCNSSSWIEVTTVAWDSSPGVENPFITNRQLYTQNDVGSSGLRVPFIGDGRPVEMRIRALYCDIAQLEVKDIPGRVRVTATGQEGNVLQAVETLIVRYPPAAGFSDFAIFSECSVVKGEAVRPDCPQ